MSDRCDRYVNCAGCPIKEMCYALLELPFGRSDTDSHLKMYEKGYTDAIEECIADIKAYARPEDSTTIIGIVYGLEQLKEQKCE